MRLVVLIGVSVDKKKKKAKEKKPKPNGRNGKGQFVKDNKIAVGRQDKPADQKAKKLKEAYVNAITEEDIKEIVEGQVKKAKGGDTTAAKEVFDRLWGRAKQEIEVGGQGGGSIQFAVTVTKTYKKK